MRNGDYAFVQAIGTGKKPHIKAFVEYYDGTSEWLTDDDFMTDSISFKDGTSTSGKFEVGGAVIGSFTFNLNNWEGKFDTKNFGGAMLTAFIGYDTGSFSNVIGTEADEEIVTENRDFIVDEITTSEKDLGISWIRYGQYFFVKHTSVGKVVKCETYDAMKLFDENMLSDNHFNYPIQAATFIRTIASHNGIVLKDTTFNGSDMMLTEPENDMTERQAIAYVGEICGCYAKIDSYGRLIFDWYGDSVYTMSSRFDHDIDTENVNITGVKVYYTDSEGNDAEALEGQEGYVISIDGNPFVTASNAETIAASVGDEIIGMTFRPGSMNILSDPRIEAGDVMTARDDKDVTITFIVTNLEYRMTLRENISCDAEPVERTDLRPTQSSVAVERARKYVRSELTAYDAQYMELSRLMSMSMGMFETREYDETGAFVLYLHNKPNLAESDTVWKKTADAFAVSTDYNTGHPTWRAGITADGNALVNVLSAIGINATWVQTGLLTDAQNNNSWNLDTGVLTLNSSTKVGTGTDTLGSMQTSITANSQGLSSKVSTTDYNGNTIASLINQTSTTTAISASKINLTGYVTVSSLGASGTTTVNGGRISGGTIVLGGASNGNGVLRINNESGTMIGRWNNAGILVKSGTIQLGSKSSYDSGNAGVYISADGVGIGRYKAQGSTYRPSVMIPTDSSKEAVILGATYFQRYPPETGYSVRGLYADEYGRITTTGAINVNTENFGAADSAYYSKTKKASDSTNYIGGITVMRTLYNFNDVIVGGDNEGASSSGDLKCWHDAYVIGRFHNESWISDKREKKDISSVSIDSSIDLIKKLRPVSFRWIKNEKNKGVFDDAVHHGLIAQDVQELGLDWGAVHESDGKLGLRYIEFIPDLINVAKYLLKENEDLRKQLAARKEIE